MVYELDIKPFCNHYNRNKINKSNVSLHFERKEFLLHFFHKREKYYEK